MNSDPDLFTPIQAGTLHAAGRGCHGPADARGPGKRPRANN